MKYEIPIIWQCYKQYSVEANSLQDAVEKALKQFLSEPDENYIDDSFEIDGIMDDEYPDETYDINQAINKI